MLKNVLSEFYNLLNISGFLIHYRGILQHYEYSLRLALTEEGACLGMKNIGKP